MHNMTIERSTTTPQSTNRSQGKALGPMVAFDIAAPLATYYLLRADGVSSVVALVVSGSSPSPGCRSASCAPGASMPWEA